MHRLFAIALLALASPAFALNNRSAVSSTGLDTNPCTVASPCRSFTAAIAQTQVGGEIIALDSAGYGPFILTATMTVSGAPGVHAALTVAAGNGITVNGSVSDEVTIRNLMLIGTGGGEGITGGARELRVLNCTVRGFTSNAIIINGGRLTVDHCVLMDTNVGVNVNGIDAASECFITDSLIENCAQGVSVLATASTTIAHCSIAGSGSAGVVVASVFGTTTSTRTVINNSNLAYNPLAIQGSASGTNNTATIYLANNDISFCPNGVQAIGPATFYTYGNNRFSEVPTVGPLTPVGQQ